MYYISRNTSLLAILNFCYVNSTTVRFTLLKLKFFEYILLDSLNENL